LEEGQKPCTWEKIAVDHDITPRQAQRIYEDFRCWEASQSDPLAVVEEALLLRLAAVERLAELSENADNSSAQLGATKAMIEIDDGRLQLMRSLGRLPKNLLRYHGEREFIAIARQMVDTMRKRGVDPAVIEEIKGLTERALPAGNVTELRPKEAHGA